MPNTKDRRGRLAGILKSLAEARKAATVDPSAAAGDSLAVSTERAVQARAAGAPIGRVDSLRLLAGGKGKFLELPGEKPMDYSQAYADSLAKSRLAQDEGAQLSEQDMSRLTRAGETVRPEDVELDKLTYAAKRVEMQDKLRQSGLRQRYLKGEKLSKQEMEIAGITEKEEKEPEGTRGQEQYTSQIQKNVTALANYAGVRATRRSAQDVLAEINEKLQEGKIRQDDFVKSKLDAIKRNQDSLSFAVEFQESGVDVNKGYQYKKHIPVMMEDFQKKLLELGFDQEKAGEWLMSEYGMSVDDLMGEYNALK